MKLIFISSVAACLFVAACRGGDKEVSDFPSPSAERASTAEAAPPSIDLGGVHPNGWQQVVGDGVSLWLPSEFVGGTASDILDSIEASGDTISPALQAQADELAANPDAIDLYAYDPGNGETGFYTKVNVTKQARPRGESVETYLRGLRGVYIEQLEATILDESAIEFGGVLVGRMIFETGAGGLPAVLTLYAIKDGDSFWNVAFGTLKEQYETYQPIFEQSIVTFAVEP